jgi:hypothetical protein
MKHQSGWISRRFVLFIIVIAFLGWFLSGCSTVTTVEDEGITLKRMCDTGLTTTSCYNVVTKDGQEVISEMSYGGGLLAPAAAVGSAALIGEGLKGSGDVVNSSSSANQSNIQSIKQLKKRW